MKAFEELTLEEQEKLRNEIFLNSAYLYDNDENFGFNPWDISSPFDGNEE